MDNVEEKSVMVALLPTTTDWCRIELPHTTVVYAGETKKVKISGFNELAKRASSVSLIARPLLVKVTGLEVFGDDEPVDVLRLESTPELLAIREMFASWDDSEFPFRPHATIGPTGHTNTNVPLVLFFDRITVGWGEEYITFWLTK